LDVDGDSRIPHISCHFQIYSDLNKVLYPVCEWYYYNISPIFVIKYLLWTCCSKTWNWIPVAFSVVELS